MRRWLSLAMGLTALALPFSVQAQPLEDARAALAAGRSVEAARLAEPLAAAGQAEALALLGLIARDAIPPETGRARALLESAAASGSATAMVALGRAYQMGKLGISPDATRALEFYERAIAAGSTVAEVNLIGLVARGALGVPDWPALTGRLGALAETGTQGAGAMLSVLLATGQGGATEPERARAIARAAADRGDVRGLRLLGWMRMQGVGGAQDVDGGLAALRRAAAMGHGAAATDLGLLYRDGSVGLAPDLAAASVWFDRAARAGDGWGATHLARLLGDGDATVPDTPARAFTLLQTGDARGIAAATHGLAIAHWDGIGTTPDPEAARAAMTRAAERGFPRALNDLGVMTETGVGSDPDPARAAELYEAAARAGDMLGAWNLADLLLNAGAAPTDPAQGYAWCLWAEDNATDEAARRQMRERCEAVTANLSADVRARGAALFVDMPPLSTPPAAAAP